MFPASVDHAPRTHRQTGAPVGQPAGVAQDTFRGLLPVGIVPVVATEDRGLWQARRRAEQATEGMGCGMFVLTRLAPARDDGSGGDTASGRTHRQTAAAQIEVEDNSTSIDMPGSQRSAAGGHAEAMQAGAIVDQRIPRQRPLGDHAAPFEIAVATFPGISEHLAVGDALRPAQTHPRQLLAGNADRQMIAARTANARAGYGTLGSVAACALPAGAGIDEDD